MYSTCRNALGFQRCWTLQEICFARDALVFFGCYSMKFHALTTFARLLYNTGVGHELELK